MKTKRNKLIGKQIKANILASLKAFGYPVTTLHLGKAVNKSRTAIWYHLNQLEESGLITRTKVPGTGNRLYVSLVNPELKVEALNIDEIQAIEGNLLAENKGSFRFRAIPFYLVNRDKTCNQIGQFG